MAIVKAVKFKGGSSKASIGKAISYITDEKKTEEKLVSGINCSPQTTLQEMQTTKKMWDKTDGRQYKHFVHSFPPTDQVTPEQVHALTLELCKDRFEGYEVLIATHTDTDHFHSHIVVNSVNFENGYKLQHSKKDLEDMKEHCNDLSRENGLSVPEKGEEITSYNMNKYKALEKAIHSDYKSYVHKCYESVMEVREQAINRDDFIAKMRDKGFETNWFDNRKHITFTDVERQEQGEKKCKVRNSKLEKDYKDPFGKEDLERGFEINNERTSTEQQAREQLERAKNIDRGTDAGDTDTIIENINQSIKNSRDAVGTDERQRRDRLAKEESIKREQERAKVERSIRNQSKQTGIER